MLRAGEGSWGHRGGEPVSRVWTRLESRVGSNLGRLVRARCLAGSINGAMSSE